MVWFAKKYTNSIGLDIADDAVRLAQLSKSGKGLALLAGGSKNRPIDCEPGSSRWQRWAAESIQEIIANNKFKGRQVCAAMPASEVFIDIVRMPKTGHGNNEEILMSRIKQKLPFNPENAMIKYIPTEEDNVLVVAAEREKVDHHLAIYEKANLQISGIDIWPSALINCYVRFFGRRESDESSVVLLLNIESNITNIVVCRHKTLLLAKSIPIGSKAFENKDQVSRLLIELKNNLRYFYSLYKKIQIERLIFLSGQSVEKEVCIEIAKQLEIPAQIGDCLAAIDVQDTYALGIDRRGSRFSWAIAFGLSCSLMN